MKLSHLPDRESTWLPTLYYRSLCTTTQAGSFGEPDYFKNPTATFLKLPAWPPHWTIAEPHGDIALAQGRGCWASGLRDSGLVGVHSPIEACVLGFDSLTHLEEFTEQHRRMVNLQARGSCFVLGPQDQLNLSQPELQLGC